MWWQRRRDGHEAPVDDAAVLTEEAEAFLAGRLVQRWHDEWLMVPAWGWITVLAHGGPGEIAALVEDTTYWAPSEKAWAPALGFLAREIMARVHDPTALQELQRQALVPVELEFLRGPVATDLQPSHLVRTVIDAMADAHPTTQG
jgi:hypothetical protein